MKFRYSIIIPTYNRANSLLPLVNTIIELNKDNQEVEIIIVDDGSTDNTSEIISKIEYDHLRYLQIENSGPAFARNRGAEIAKGDFLIFIDDDCIPAKNYFLILNQTIESNSYDAFGGQSKNKIAENKLAEFYDKINSFYFSNQHNNNKFLMSNNMICKRDIFWEESGFDERFTIGAEDRELAIRLADKQYKVGFVEELSVNHYHDFSLRSFLFQYYKFGRGSYLLYDVISKENNYKIARINHLKQFFNIYCALRKDQNITEKFTYFLILLLSQLFTAFGYVSAKWEGIKDLRDEKSDSAKTFTSGRKGTVIGLFSFLGGNLFSSVLGFATFIILGKYLELEQFGNFMIAFSLLTIISKFTNFGLPISVTRYASDSVKLRDKEKTSFILKNGIFIQSIVLFLSLLIFLLLNHFLEGEIEAFKLPVMIKYGIAIGIVSTTLFDFFLIIYSIQLEYLKIAFINNLVAFLRLTSVLLLIIILKPNAGILFWAYAGSGLIGAIILSIKYFSNIVPSSKINFEEIKKLLKYGSFETVTGISRQIISNGGPLILASLSTKAEAGLYGIGMSLSFVYSVIALNIRSYFFPIGSRLISNDTIIPFIRRTVRLTLPLFFLGIISLIIAKPILESFYSESKAEAYPVFVLLSLPAILKLFFSSLLILLHYYFKPQYIAYEAFGRSILFLIIAFIVSGYGAIGVASALLLTSLIGVGVILYLVHNELKKNYLRLKDGLRF
ncbi:MAG: glycosyltransferase [Melioribacteraceae bacterium]|nr:glycosyltransferase [Melioribacteraceae bacterium]